MDQRKLDLEEMFGDEANYQIGHAGDHEGSLFPDGTRAVVCYNWSLYVRRALGPSAELWGFDGGSNADALISQLADGHDFAIVDGRYIVDGWVKNIESLCDRAVFDLQDPEDHIEISRLYGNPETWQRSAASEFTIDREDRHRRMVAMSGVRLPSWTPPNSHNAPQFFY